MRKGMSVQKKCLKKNKYFKNKFLAKNVFINGDIGGMGIILVIWVELHLPHITRMNALSFWKER